ncbi:MAG TPA: TauD/TfdA family dioxygenase [Pseudonocardiaceae bacterium]|jgi:gamma-butyrobetaine dioxygenase|nr:TauD/TfdA family dioxygenase [Pseudonocardiaceae bacterium]
MNVPAIWLRDNCHCPECRHPGNGQKLHGITDLPAGVGVAEQWDEGEHIRVRFTPDGHVGTLPRELIARATAGELPADERTEQAKQTWLPAELDTLPQADWADYQADPQNRIDALNSILSQGFLLLHGVPTVPGQVLDVATSFGFVRHTNYGDLFDVRVEQNPVNLAFTALPITPHTDNPYRDPVPTLQLLHCLHNDAEGGNSGLVDGFRAAAMLREHNHAAFDTLTHTAVTFAFESADAALSATRPMIGTDPYGRIREVRFNNRSLQPVPVGPDTEDFYAAHRAFAEVLQRPELQLTLHLAPGDCLVFDNTRVLHARTAFGSTGRRHLQGCYADLDSLASTITLLRKENPRPAERTLADLFAGDGAADYLGEEVTLAVHMLQTGALAAAQGAPDHLVAAALLHDVGHLTGVISGQELMAGRDNHHSDTGADWLAQWFPASVTQPVRLHVAAKRYLCAVDPDYVDELSPASVYTLGVQGGPMSATEIAAFEASPHHADAVAVRRWDDAAKDPAVPPPTFATFAPLLAELAEQH